MKYAQRQWYRRYTSLHPWSLLHAEINTQTVVGKVNSKDRPKSVPIVVVQRRFSETTQNQARKQKDIDRAERAAAKLEKYITSLAARRSQPDSTPASATAAASDAASTVAATPTAKLRSPLWDPEGDKKTFALLKQSTDRTYQRLQQTGKRSIRAGNAAAVASTAGPRRSSKRRGRAKSSPTRDRKPRRAVTSDDGRERQTTADTSGRDVSVSGSISDGSRSGCDDDGNRSSAGSAGCGSLEGVPKKTRRRKKSSQGRYAC